MIVKKWWPLLVAVASILVVIGFGLFRKEILSAMPGSPWNELRDFQWESVVAGALGLMGGVFVITSSRAQIRAMEISTDKTINLAKNHHADELNAPLQLAYDVADDLWNWSNKTLDHLEGIQEQVAAGTCNARKLESAIDRVYRQLSDRIEHIGDIRKQHRTTKFSFDVISVMHELEGILSRDITVPLSTPPGKEFHAYRVLIHRLGDGRTLAAGTRTKIHHQMNKVRERCGIAHLDTVESSTMQGTENKSARSSSVD